MRIDDFEFIVLLIAVLFFTGFLAWLTVKAGMFRPKQKSAKKASKKKGKKTEKKPELPVSIFEKYDYLGTKIFHNDGKYTVVEDDISRNFNSLNELPQRYQKMILEMQTQNFPGKKNRYYMENKNGIYTVVFPDGARKTFKNYNDIPDNLKKILTGS